MVLMALWCALLIWAAAGWCDGCPLQDIAGRYHASEMRLTRAGNEVDLLAEGARLVIRLDPFDSSQGTTDGSLLLPAAYTESGTTETESLLGRYWYDSTTDTVAFDHDSDSFLPYLSWQVEGAALKGTFSAANDRLKVTLQRDE